MSGYSFDCHNGDAGTPGVWQEEAGDAANILLLYTDTHRKNYLAPNVDRAETEKPWSRLT